MTTTTAEGVTPEQIEAGIDAQERIIQAMRDREESGHPEDMPDYDEGDVCRAIYLAMRQADPAWVKNARLRGLLIETQDTIRDAAKGGVPRFGELWNRIDAALSYAAPPLKEPDNG